jgi:pyruvate,water dikinase
MRRAVLAAGRRLAATTRLASADLAIEATADELAASLRSGAAMDSAELERRAAARRSLRAADAPRLLGPPEPAMPDSMPGALGTVFRIFAIYEFGDAPTAADMSGVGIGRRAVEGTARLVLGDDGAAERFEPGDILVAPMTSPSYNMLLAIAGGVITEEGSMMSHAAIMARELDIPAVLGVIDATRRINDGDRVRVDPVAGRIEILAPSEQPDSDTGVNGVHMGV